jgi:hypothetical protein
MHGDGKGAWLVNVLSNAVLAQEEKKRLPVAR